MFRRSFKQVLEVVTTFAMLCAALTVLWKVWSPSIRSTTTSPVEDVGEFTIGASAISNVMGEGTVAIIEFADFQCPYCAKYAADTWPRVKRDLVESGKSRYIAMHYPLERIHPMAIGASQAAECAGRQGKFWEMHERLFASKALSPTDLVEHAEELELNREEFEPCLHEEQTRADIVADLEEGTRLGVKGTPMFFIGLVQPNGDVKLSRRLRGAISFEVLRAEVESALSAVDQSKRARRSEDGGCIVCSP